jgi:aspartyl-tRNA(Asn)/glutamyl-tRNA(Gln) amidotransferase subunit C
MKIDESTIDAVSTLVKLDIAPEEKIHIAEELEHILDYIDTMNQLDTDDVEPVSHVFEYGNVLRDDIVTNEDNSMELVTLAPFAKNTSYLVPKTVE